MRIPDSVMDGFRLVVFLNRIVFTLAGLLLGFALAIFDYVPSERVIRAAVGLGIIWGIITVMEILETSKLVRGIYLHLKGRPPNETD